MRFKPVWVQPIDVFYETVFNFIIQQWKRRNISLALKSGFLYQNSCGLMAIIVVNQFLKIRILFIQQGPNVTKTKRQILVKDPIDSNFFKWKWGKARLIKHWKEYCIILYNISKGSVYIRVEQIVPFGNKIHKQGNRRRVIVSSNGHPTERLLQFVDYQNGSTLWPHTYDPHYCTTSSFKTFLQIHGLND